jgi:hypothetical protein
VNAPPCKARTAHAPRTTACRRAQVARAAAALAALAWLAVLAGCAPLKPPQPWEKGHLAKPEMGMGGDGLEQRFSQHIYNSKEAASGGTGVGGGGCGCN